MAPTSNLRGIGCMIISAGAFVATDCCMKTVMDAAPPLQVLFMRGVAGTLWSALAVFALGYAAETHWLVNRWVIARALCEVVAVGSFVLALAHMPLGDLTAIYQIAPLIVLVGAAWLFGDRIGPLRYGLIALGFLGAMLVAQPGSSAASPYALLGFLTAAGTATRDLVAKRISPDAPAFITGFSTIIVVMLAAGLGGALTETWKPPGGLHIGLMTLAGFLLIFGHFFVVTAYRIASIRAVAPFYYAFMVWAVIAGLFVFGDWPNRLALAGMALIVASGLAIMLLEGRRDVVAAEGTP